jgi:hypothetical protein
MSSTLGNDPELAAQSLAKLWPNRLHESNFFKNMFYRVGPARLGAA